MFSKPAPKPDNRISPAPESNPLAIPAPGTEATARNRARPASILAQNLVIEGSVQSDSEVQIDGLVRGDVRVERLTIGETGRVEGQVVAETAEVRGRVAGGISAKQVRLHSTASVEGDITAEQLAIEPGASFEGRSIKLQRPKAEVAPSPAPTTAPTATPSA
ncbi:polymer-forming cytoskeletal protein [Phenylobacterium sp.]|jgi:cytoskeletal protein CcmA (bactofilin family)|uniref:polymer-forming cytoskeletal protein n=1 Tax=Phenylobacterium sp. TaxID=1871053 RepID=UPI0037C9B19D